MKTIRFIASTLMLWFLVSFVYAESAPFLHRHGLSLWPAKHAVAHAIGTGSNEAVLVRR